MQIHIPGKVHIDHVMWQPTSTCQMGCRGCYVEASPSSLYKGPVKDDIFKLIFEDKNVICNQITISLDTFVKPPEDVVVILKKIWAIYSNKPSWEPPKLCVTAYNWATVLTWTRAMNIPERDFLKPLTILSLSNFPVRGAQCQELKELCEANSVTLNFNYMVKGDEANNKAFEMGLRYCNQIYLVLKKPALGQIVDIVDMQNWFKARAVVQKEAPKKLIDDACMTDSQNYSLTQKTCGAGISKLHVWPDGSVTGCPYDSHQVAHEGGESTFDQMYRTVHDRHNHPMMFCDINKTLKVLQQKAHQKRLANLNQTV